MAKNTHTCPLSQDACDESCSWGERANCEYHEGLVDGRAQAQVRTVFTVVQTTEDATPEPVRVCALRSFRTLRAARAFCVEHIIRRAQNYANFAWMLVHDANHEDLLENLVAVTGRGGAELDAFFDRTRLQKRAAKWLLNGLRQYLEDEVGEQYYVYCGQLSGDSYHLDILESRLEGA